MNVDMLSSLVVTGVQSVSTMYNAENTRLRRTDRQCWAIIIKYEGETIYSCGKSRIVSDINNLVILPKGSAYTWQCTKSGHFISVEFDCDTTHPEPIALPVKRGDRILNLMKALEHKRSVGGSSIGLESIRDTYSIILEILRSCDEKYIPDSKRQKISPAVEYITHHYDENITNDTLAAIAGMSTVYFRKLFTAVMGVSPIAYSRQLRIEKAKEMLRSDYGSLTDLAYTLGYPSLYDFSRDFKKHTGVPPSGY